VRGMKHVKVDLEMNLRLKSIVKVKKLKIVVSNRINSTSKINSTLNHPNIVKSILESLESLLTF